MRVLPLRIATLIAVAAVVLSGVAPAATRHALAGRDRDRIARSGRAGLQRFDVIESVTHAEADGHERDAVGPDIETPTDRHSVHAPPGGVAALLPEAHRSAPPSLSTVRTPLADDPHPASSSPSPVRGRAPPAIA